MPPKEFGFIRPIRPGPLVIAKAEVLWRTLPEPRHLISCVNRIHSGHAALHGDLVNTTGAEVMADGGDEILLWY